MSGSNARSKSQQHAILEGVLFFALAFLITWGTGMLIVVSNHANLVHGAYQVRNPITLPTPIAIMLVMIGSFGPFWRQSGLGRCAAGVRVCADFSVSSGGGECILFGSLRHS